MPDTVTSGRGTQESLAGIVFEFPMFLRLPLQHPAVMVSASTQGFLKAIVRIRQQATISSSRIIVCSVHHCQAPTCFCLLRIPNSLDAV